MSYSPPLGIPAPSFGINELHTDYSESTYNFGAGPVAYPDAGNGPYTHYVDSSHGSATDSGNTYGSPTTPRLTLPKNLTAGSVVEIHGSGPYSWDLGSTVGNLSAANGNVNSPIFIRGFDPNNRVAVRNTVDERMYETHYLIIENLFFDLATAGGPRVYQNSDHICFRRCTIANAPRTFGTACMTFTQGSGFVPGRYVSHIVVYQCIIGPNGLTDGVIDPTFESAIQGITLNNSTDHIWILDCHFDRNAEDGIHVAIPAGNGDEPCNFVYIGNCLFENNGENDIDIKNGTNIIISNNTMHGTRVLSAPSGGGGGQSIVVNDEGDNDNIWIINNHIYDCVRGIGGQAGGNPVDGKQTVYVVGNVIENMIIDPVFPDATTQAVCIDCGSGAEWTIVNNTFNIYQNGVRLNNNETNVFRNNIFSNRFNSGTVLPHDIYVNNQVGHTVVATDNLYYPTKSALKSNYDWSDSITADPKFVSISNYRLQEDSPARNAGANPGVSAVFNAAYGLSIDADIAGTSRPQQGSWDIGAYEFVSRIGEPRMYRINTIVTRRRRG